MLFRSHRIYAVLAVVLAWLAGVMLSVRAVFALGTIFQEKTLSQDPSPPGFLDLVMTVLTHTLIGHL